MLLLDHVLDGHGAIEPSTQTTGFPRRARGLESEPCLAMAAPSISVIVLLATALLGAAGFGVSPAVCQLPLKNYCRAAPVVAAARGRSPKKPAPKNDGAGSFFDRFSVSRAAPPNRCCAPRSQLMCVCRMPPRRPAGEERAPLDHPRRKR